MGQIKEEVWNWANNLKDEERAKAIYLYNNLKKETEEIVGKIVDCSKINEHPLIKMKNLSKDDLKLEAVRHFIKTINWKRVLTVDMSDTNN